MHVTPQSKISTARDNILNICGEMDPVQSNSTTSVVPPRQRERKCRGDAAMWWLTGILGLAAKKRQRLEPVYCIRQWPVKGSSS
jgi:hypothetical protein